MAAIDFDELFNRIGRLGHVAYVLAGDQAAIPAVLTDLFNNYEGTSDNDLVGNYLAQQPNLPRSVTALPGQIAGLASSTLVRMVKASVPSIGTVPNALVELIRQMRAGSQTVKASAITLASSALSTNVGSGTVVLSTKRGDGLVQENTVAEVLRLSCTVDSYTGGATAGRETFQLAGAAQTAGLWDYNYPTGSAGGQTTNVVSPTQDASASGNMLTNGDFEDWSTDVPPQLSNFVMSGTWGTDMARSSTAYQGSYSLQMKAGTTANIYQQFSSTTGTTTTPTPLYSYAVYFRIRAVAGTVSGGVLTVELVDGSGTVTNDQQGVANSYTITLNTTTTSWVASTGLFRIPNVPPTTLRLRFRVSTALAGDDILVDSLCFSPLKAAYNGGFGFVLFGSTTPYVKADAYDITATNARGGQSYLATFQSLFDRLFGMRGLNLLLPTSGSPSQADSKITS